LASNEYQKAAQDYCFKRGKGKQRALAKLRRLMHPAVLLNTTPDDPVCVWAWLEPSGAVLDTTDPGRSQNCVLTSFAIAGRTSRCSAASNHGWTLEVPDHALGRLIERCRGADPAAALWQASNAFLNAGLSEIVACLKNDQVFYLPAADGLFLCEAIAINDDAFGLHIYARARTRLATDMLQPEQTPIAAVKPEHSMRFSVTARLYE